MDVLICLVDLKRHIPMVVDFAKEVAKKYNLVDITNDYKPCEYQISICTEDDEKEYLRLGTDDDNKRWQFYEEFGIKIFEKYRIWVEWR